MIPANTLLEESKCYLCLGISQVEALILALYNRIIETPVAPVGPAMTISQLGQVADGTDAITYSTTSQSPAANSLVLAAVLNCKATTPDTPVLSGNGLTWVVVGVSTVFGSSSRLTLFRAMGAAPTPGVVTATFGGATQIGCSIACVEFKNVKTTGTNGSGAVQQVSQNGSTSANPNTALAAFNANGRNSGFAVTGNLRNPYAGTPEAGWFTIINTGHDTPSRGLLGVYRTSTTDNTVVVTAGITNWYMIAIEVNHSSS